jgi:hypothetical protein
MGVVDLQILWRSASRAGHHIGSIHWKWETHALSLTPRISITSHFLASADVVSKVST